MCRTPLHLRMILTQYCIVMSNRQNWWWMQNFGSSIIALTDVDVQSLWRLTGDWTLKTTSKSWRIHFSTSCLPSTNIRYYCASNLDNITNSQSKNKTSFIFRLEFWFKQGWSMQFCNSRSLHNTCHQIITFPKVFRAVANFPNICFRLTL